MRALLLAAGLGTRLHPLTLETPKCLVSIAGRPLLDHWLDLLFQGGIERVLINTSWLSEKVEAHIAKSPYRSAIDVVFEPELLGTGGTILANRRFFGSRPFFIAHADNLTNFDLKAFRAAHDKARRDCALSLIGFYTDNPKSCGILRLDARGRVVGFHEKVPDPPGNLANGAIYICEPEVIDTIASLQKPIVDLSTEILPRFLGRMFCQVTGAYLRDIGSLESLKIAEREWRSLMQSPALLRKNKEKV